MMNNLTDSVDKVSMICDELNKLDVLLADIENDFFDPLDNARKTNNTGEIIEFELHKAKTKIYLMDEVLTKLIHGAALLRLKLEAEMHAGTGTLEAKIPQS